MGMNVLNAIAKKWGNNATGLRFLIASTATILVVISAVAAGMAWSLGLLGGTGVGDELETPRVPSGVDVRESVSCAECGVVQSTRANEVTRLAEITLRMNDGASRLFFDADHARWKPGQRVVYIEGGGTAAQRSNESPESLGHAGPAVVEIDYRKESE